MKPVLIHCRYTLLTFILFVLRFKIPVNSYSGVHGGVCSGRALDSESRGPGFNLEGRHFSVP